MESSNLTELKALPEAEFQAFFKWLPARTQILIRGGMVAWQDVLPEWYGKYKEGVTV